MKILNAQQIREADKVTIEGEPIASIDLMERAARQCFTWIREHFSTAHTFCIMCGVGNNGGDGLAIARLLRDAGKDVAIYIVGDKAKASADFAINLARLEDKTYRFVEQEEDIAGQFDIAVDALLGNGLNKPATGLLGDVIDAFNALQSIKIALDIPSGLFADDNSNNNGKIIKADYTLTFELPKLSFFFAESAQYVGLWQVLPIGLNLHFIDSAPSANNFVLGTEISKLLIPRSVFAHKGTYGHTLLIGGSKGKIGAMVLAAKAAGRVGAGLTTAYIPNCGYTVVQTAVPSAMCMVDVEENNITDIPKTDAYSAIGIGPGMGTGNEQANALKKLLNYTTAPLLIDADALNILAENPTWLHFLPPNTILTPHPGEFDRLAQMPKGSNGFDRYTKQRELSQKLNCYIVLKGAYTSISCPDGAVFFNSTGNPGMATGGSGDVLTGIITGMLAQHYKPRLAAVVGVYLHGLAGDLAAAELSQQALIADDIVNYLPKAFLYLRNGA